MTTSDAPKMQEAFAEQLDVLGRRVFGGSFSAPVRLTGGASQEIWSFETAEGQGLILRRTPPGDRMDRGDCVSPETEAAVIEAVRVRGVPVPQVLHVLAPADGLGRGFLMTRIAGEAAGRRIVRDTLFAGIRPRLAALSGQALSGVHATPLDGLPELPVRGPSASIDLLEGQLRTGPDARPVFEAALAWLRRNCPDETPPRLVHGDFRTGNFLASPQGITAVLDWEGCYLGDPIADLGWLCNPIWRFGRLDLPVGGFGRREDLLAGYGAPVDPQRLRFWELFGILRWGLTCRVMATAFLAGEASIERAAVGRRASEAELELLHALLNGGD
jgi:aminoglycoside phosphotransferase (APT) family kinase protein